MVSTNYHTCMSSTSSCDPLVKSTSCYYQIVYSIAMVTILVFPQPIKPASGGSGWESIRQLDDEENWTERNSIISKQDHQHYSEYAQVLLQCIYMYMYTAFSRINALGI